MEVLRVAVTGVRAPVGQWRLVLNLGSVRVVLHRGSVSRRGARGKYEGLGVLDLWEDWSRRVGAVWDPGVVPDCSSMVCRRFGLLPVGREGS